MRLFRVTVPTQDIDAAKAFYEHVLGMKADETVPSRLYFHSEGSIIVLVDWAIEGTGDFAPNPDNLYFATKQLDATHRRTVGAGALTVSSIAVQPWGERSFYCHDLDGNPVCFVDDKTLFLGEGADWA